MYDEQAAFQTPEILQENAIEYNSTADSRVLVHDTVRQQEESLPVVADVKTNDSVNEVFAAFEKLNDASSNESKDASETNNETSIANVTSVDTVPSAETQTRDSSKFSEVDLSATYVMPFPFMSICFEFC